MFSVFKDVMKKMYIPVNNIYLVQLTATGDMRHCIFYFLLMK